MANEEQLAILRQGVEVWNKWRVINFTTKIDLTGADLRGMDLREIQLWGVNLQKANLRGALFSGANLILANLKDADLNAANLMEAKLVDADLTQANLNMTDLRGADMRGSNQKGCIFSKAKIGGTIFGKLDLSLAIGLEDLVHRGPSFVSTDVFALSKGKIPEVFLRGCGLSDADIEYAKLANPNLSNEEKSKILYRVYDLQASQAIQISPLFISYSHGNKEFVDILGDYLTKKGVRFWRDIHDMKAGRMEKQIDRAIRQNPTVLLVLSEHSLASDWVEHEVRTARQLEKVTERDVLCPIALDDSWKSSRWPKRIMEQIMEYNILDFSEWEDDVKFEEMFRKLIDGLELFYKG